MKDSVRKFPLPQAAVEECQRGYLILKVVQTFVSLLLLGNGLNRIQLFVQSVQEKRVNDLMYVLNARIVHAAGTSGLGVQSALEHSTENSWRDAAPVEIQRTVFHQELKNFVGQTRNLNVLI